MDIALSNIVQSTAGRDKGHFFLVVDMEKDFIFLADGKQHKVETPKKKRLKHVRFVGVSEHAVAQKIRNKEKINNSELRKAIAVINGGNEDQEG